MAPNDYTVTIQGTRGCDDDGAYCAGPGEPLACPDCDGGRLQWAEAGYVPWHRICDGCGSHWDLHPVTFYGGAGQAWQGTGEDGRLVPLSAVRLRDAPVSPAALLQFALDADAVERQDNGIWVASAAWAQRARFYGGRA